MRATKVSKMMTPPIIVRNARPTDRAAILAVEAKATPGLRYVPAVFDLFMADARGGFLVAEIAGEVVACGKFTVLPDGSAWLETLRVIPERQGLGIGKRFYEHFFTLAAREGVTTMRMYTGTKNLVSKGLAEHFGFRCAERFSAAWHPGETVDPAPNHPAFQAVTDPTEATTLLLAHADAWQQYLVMNRTFYRLTPPLCAALAAAGQVYATPARERVIALGARFMPAEALHIGLFGDNAEGALDFAKALAAARGVPRLTALFSTAANAPQQQLMAAGFQLEPAEFIVMEVTL